MMSISYDAPDPSLITRYSEKQRHYHNLTHVTSLLDLLSSHHSKSQTFSDDELEILRYTIWFHDCVCDPMKGGGWNERESERIWREFVERQPKLIHVRKKHTLAFSILISVCTDWGSSLDYHSSDHIPQPPWYIDPFTLKSLSWSDWKFPRHGPRHPFIFTSLIWPLFNSNPGWVYSFRTRRVYQRKNSGAQEFLGKRSIVFRSRGWDGP